MYSPQQLYQFIQYAKNYLELQDVQFKSGDNFIDPNNEEDVTKLISIALAEHRDGDKPSGFAQNIPGDQGRSRGPWQIYGSTWESVLREYDVFNSFEDINDALDDPGLNAIAALLVAQYDVGERQGLDNWTTKDIASQQEFLDAAKEYDTQLIENPERIQNPDGTIEEIPAEPTAAGFERTQAPQILEQSAKSIANMASELKLASKGQLLKNKETYVSFTGNQVRSMVGEDINNMHKNLLAGVNIADLSNREIADLYAKNIHPYLPYDASYRGVDMQGNGQNIVDLLQGKNVNPNDSFYVPGEQKVISGDDVNKRVNLLKSYMYQYFLNKKEQEPLSQLNSVYEYIFRTAHPYIKVTDDVMGAIGDEPSNTNLIKQSGYNPFPSMFSGENEVRRSGYNPVASAQEAAPTFLNNLEKILRVKPQGSKVRKPQERNAISDFLNR